MDAQFLQSRIDKMKTLIETYEDALLQLGTNGVKSYRLDTGQTQTMVTRQDMVDMRDVLDGLYNQLAVLERRRNGRASIMGPAF